MHVFEGGCEGILVGCRGAVDEPGNSLEADSNIDDLDVELLTGPVVEGLELHKDHVTDLKSVNKVLDGGTEVTTAGPHVLDERDLLWVDFERLC